MIDPLLAPAEKHLEESRLIDPLLPDLGGQMMFHRYRYLSITVVCIVVAIAALIPRGQVASADPKPAPQPAVGRYQVFKAADTTERLLDTATGKVWRFKDPNAVPAEWELLSDAPK